MTEGGKATAKVKEFCMIIWVSGFTKRWSTCFVLTEPWNNASVNYANAVLDAIIQLHIALNTVRDVVAYAQAIGVRLQF